MGRRARSNRPVDREQEWRTDRYPAARPCRARPGSSAAGAPSLLRGARCRPRAGPVRWPTWSRRDVARGPLPPVLVRECLLARASSSRRSPSQPAAFASASAGAAESLIGSRWAWTGGEQRRAIDVYRQAPGGGASDRTRTPPRLMPRGTPSRASAPPVLALIRRSPRTPGWPNRPGTAGAKVRATPPSPAIGEPGRQRERAPTSRYLCVHLPVGGAGTTPTLTTR